jgi:hypothetical protein
MTIAINLPSSAPVTYTKPTLANTKGGKLYKPTHPECFRVVFEALPVQVGAGASEEGEAFSSKLVAVKVRQHSAA